MTTKRKIKVLELALWDIENNEEACMCWAISSHLTEREYDKIAFRILSSFGIRRPQDALAGSFWFAMDKHGRTRRIQILKNAIKKLKKL